MKHEVMNNEDLRRAFRVRPGGRAGFEFVLAIHDFVIECGIYRHSQPVDDQERKECKLQRLTFKWILYDEIDLFILSNSFIASSM